MKKFLLPLLLALSVLVSPVVRAENILWLGNSLTKLDEIPMAFRDVATAAGRATPVYAEQILWGNPLQAHIDRFNELGTGSVLHTGLPAGQTWDYVVLQDYGQDEGANFPDDTVQDALTLTAMIRAHSPNAKIVMYNRWAYGDNPNNSEEGQLIEQAKFDTSNQAAADAINAAYGAGTARLSDVGGGFAQRGFAQDLYAGTFQTSVWTATGDWLHHGYQGALLSAMIHYGTIYGDATLADIPFFNFANSGWMNTNMWDTPSGGKHMDYLTEAQWNSLVATAEFILGGGSPRVGKPTLSPAAGNYVTTQTVTLASSTPGATIRYTLDGSIPSATAGTLYTAPFTLSSTATLRAVASKAGQLNSLIVKAGFGIGVTAAATPVITPAAGTTYTTPQSISITSATPGVSIRYTTDGSTPTSTTGTLYTGSFPTSTTLTVKAIAYAPSLSDSAVATSTISVVLPIASTPVISPSAGTYTSLQTITLSTASAGAVLRYTLDGSTPSATVGTVYSGPFVLGASATIKAIATKVDLQPSAVVTAAFTINLPTASAPEILPGGGATTGPQTVVLSSGTPGAAIRYTLDGSTPTAGNGIVYSGPFSLNRSATLKAVTTADGFLDSAVSAASFSISGITAGVATLHEPFAYATGALAGQNGGTGFGGAYPAGGTQTAIAPLAGLPTAYTQASTGNAAQFTGGNFSRLLGTGNTVNLGADGVRYFSFLYRHAAPRVVASPAAILQWTAFAGNSGGSANPTETAGTRNANLQVSSATLSRGSGFNPSGNQAYGWWGSNMFGTQGGEMPADLVTAVSQNTYAAFTVTPASGHGVSLSAVNFYAYNTGGAISKAELVYSTNNFSTYTGLGTRTLGATGALLTYDLSAVSALQGVTTPVAFRIYFYGESGGYQLRGLGGDPGSATPALQVVGTVNANATAADTGGVALGDAAGNRLKLFGVDLASAPSTYSFNHGASGAGITGVTGGGTLAGASGATTYFVAGRITSRAGQADQVDCRIYSGSEALGGSEPATWTRTFGFGSAVTLDRIEFQNSVQIDELRFGPDWASVAGTEPIMTQAAAPVITPAGGTFATNPVAVTLAAANAGATIRFTTDGSIPTAMTGMVYSGAFLLTANATVRALATADGLEPSAVASAAFTLPSLLTPIESWFQSSGLPTNTSLTLDSDGDGVPNLLEYALGGHPNSSADVPGVQTTVDVANHLQIGFQRARSGVTYIVQGSNDLVGWTDLATNPGNVGEAVTFTDSANLGTTPRRFLRLKVVAP